MKSAVLAFSMLLLALAAAPNAGAAEEPGQAILGSWVFHKIIFRGDEQPPFNPDLVLVFEFFPDGTDRLFWTRRNQRGFCERRGVYSWDAESSLLLDEVTWTHPDNAAECGRDPDMMRGKRTQTRLEAVAGELRLWLYVGEEPLIYVWKRLLPDA